VFGRLAGSLAKPFGIDPTKAMDGMHNVCGDTGSAHPLVMLVLALQEAQPGDKILMVAHGQGCTAMIFEVTDNIAKMKDRVGIKGSLEDRKEEENYMKFLSHRGLLQQDWMMRAETDWKTALTALYRGKKMILSMIGGRCTKCGTYQFPKHNICVNPQCGAVHTLEDAEFADEPAKIKTYTSDLLTYTPDPPAHYGMVEFDNGGRGMFDFTDYEQGKIEVGLPVRMVFRIKNIDRARNFTQYYWKAKPVSK